MGNILYFEGAGMYFDDEELKRSDVGNHRIRTAFLNDEGKGIYIELSKSVCVELQEYGISGRLLKKPKRMKHDYRIGVFSCFETDKGENDSTIDLPWEMTKKLDYTKENILKLINEKLNCSFDAIEVLPRFSGYNVFKGNGKGYNYSNDFENVPKRTEARNRVYNEVVKEHYEKIYREHIVAKKDIGLRMPKYESWHLSKMDDRTITVRSHANAELIDNNQRIATFEVNY